MKKKHFSDFEKLNHNTTVFFSPDLLLLLLFRIIHHRLYSCEMICVRLRSHAVIHVLTLRQRNSDSKHSNNNKK